MALNSQQQSQLASALQSKGYNEADARNAAADSGGRAMDLYREYVGGSTGGGGGVDQATESLRKAIAVSTDALKGQQSLIPQVTQQKRTAYETQQTNLQSRYDSLINEVKEQTSSAVNRTTGTTREELARRGINLQGNLAQQEVNSAVNPLNIEGGRQITNIGLAREDDLSKISNAIAALPLEEQQQWLELQKVIGQLQMSGSQTELDLALKLMAQQQQEEQARQTMEYNLSKLEQDKLLNAAQIKNIESQILERNKSGSGSGGLTAQDQAIINAWMGNSNNSSLPSYFKPVTVPSNLPYTPMTTGTTKHADFINKSPTVIQSVAPRPVPTPGMSR